jgi:acetyl-CoA carboxylase biotin carboxyl carrier protein
VKIDLKQLESLLKVIEDHQIAEFEFQDDQGRLSVKRGQPAAIHAASAPAAPVAVPAGPAVLEEAPAVDASVAFITSPFVGTFYRRPSPEAAPFVEVATAVKKGQPLCIVEAMKLMNEIEAEYACTILEILAENASSVEFGQKLFRVRKS